jgi:hypothetical protein
MTKLPHLLIAGATVLLAGGAAMALPILRMSDEQFAQGSS